jgi:hypothetical protein
MYKRGQVLMRHHLLANVLGQVQPSADFFFPARSLAGPPRTRGLLLGLASG